MGYSCSLCSTFKFIQVQEDTRTTYAVKQIAKHSVQRGEVVPHKQQQLQQLLKEMQILETLSAEVGCIGVGQGQEERGSGSEDRSRTQRHGLRHITRLETFLET